MDVTGQYLVIRKHLSYRKAGKLTKRRRYYHATREAATAEAERLAREGGGPPDDFLVLRIEGEASTGEV